MIVISHTANRFKSEVGPLARRGRQPEAGTKQDEDRCRALLSYPIAHRGETYALLLARRGMNDLRAPAGGALGRGDRRIEVRHDFDQVERFYPARVEAAAV